jgi:hypothetical protein
MALLKSNTIIYGTANVQSVLAVGGVTPNNSVNISTGSLVVTGGVGISGNTYVGGIIAASGPSSTVYVTQSQLSQDISNTNAHLYTLSMFSGNTDQSIQIGGQNFANTQNSSTDLALYNNLGTDVSNFIDMGITSFAYNTTINNFTAAQPGDAYLYSNGVNLLLGTQTIGKNLKIFVGGYNASNVAATFNAPNTASTSNITGTLTVVGGVGVKGNVATDGIIFADGTRQTTAGGGGGSSSGYLANSIIFANTTGYLSNVNGLQFFSSNNTIRTTSLTLTTGAGGQITFADGTTQSTRPPRFLEIIAVPSTSAQSATANVFGVVEIPVSGTINLIRARTTTGTCNVIFKINSSNIGYVNANTSGAANTVSTTINAYDALTVDVLSPTGNGLVVIVRVQE